jgi:hypothetical protein
VVTDWRSWRVLYCRSEALGRLERSGVLLALKGRPTLAAAPALTEPYNETSGSLRPSKKADQ